MIVDEFFKKEYLIAGNTYDNFIFENCPKDFLPFAESMLKEHNDEVKSCVISLNRKKEELIEKTLNNCGEEFQKQILARDFITAVIVKELLKHKTTNQNIKDYLNEQIDAFIRNDFKKVKEFHKQSYMPYDIKRIAKEIGKIELSFVLEDTQNTYLQQAINVFVSSREPYSVKIFTNNEILATYYDLNGNIIECPHDFMRRDVNKFIEESVIER